MMYRPVPRPQPPPKPKRSPFVVLFLLALTGTYAAYAIFRPLSPPVVKLTPPVIPAEIKVQLPWPSFGHAAFGADGYGLLATYGEQKPIGTASTTKVITALAVLEKKPLRPGEQGPVITMTEEDVRLYEAYVARGGSATPVAVGSQLTQYQALQALMMASANNMADTLVTWAFGSMEAYTVYANQLVSKLDMKQTRVTDASGFSPTTISTAADLIKLADAAYDHPVIADIAAQKTAVIPGVGTIRNVNALLGQSGIVGLKTGNTDENPGAFISAAVVHVDGKPLTVFTATMLAPDRMQAMGSSVPLIQDAPKHFKNVPVIKAGQTVGTATTVWGSKVDIVAAKDISVLAWKGTALAPRVSSQSLSPEARKGDKAGMLELAFHGQTHTSDLQVAKSLPPPSTVWRLTHPWDR